MKLGIGTYTYMWSIGFAGAQPVAPMDALGLLSKAHDLGLHVVQFGPNLPLDELTEAQLQEVLDYARHAQVDLELGTRGLETQHLRRQIELAERLKCGLIRTVPELPSGDTPCAAGLLESLARIIPELESHHKIISKTHQVRLAPTLRFDFLLKPQIENEVEIKVTQHG